MLTVHGCIRSGALMAVVLGACVAGRANAEDTDRPKEVLVLNSTRLSEQFYVVAEREMPKLLSDGLEQRLNYYTEYLDVNRFPQPEYETVYVDFLRQKYGRKRFDLLLLMGDDAMDFMSRRGSTLLNGAPAVFYSLSPPDTPIANSTGLLNMLRFGPSIALALLLQPDLKHVYVVSGAAPSDHDFESQAREEFHAFEGRVEFTYLSGLATKDLEERLRALPPHSAVYYVVVTRDGAGETFQQMAYLSRVATAANAPTYSWADAAADSGIVGGSRRDQVAQMKAIATLALRVLRGERADEIPVSSPNTDVESVDWRQLRRWGLDESRVPTGTRVLFRPPSIWDQYRRFIIGAFMLMLAQTALIAGLLVQRAKRQAVERTLRGSERELLSSRTKLLRSYDQVRHLSRRLISEQEAERTRIARELHDDVGQQLAKLGVELVMLRPNLREDQRASQLSQALETVQGVSTSVRELSHRLHPSKLQLVGLVASLDSLRNDLSRADLHIDFTHHDVPGVIDHDIALCLFRVAQEALGNAIKHSGASHVRVELRGGPSTLELLIADDGKGFDVDHVANGGLGLISMRERVASVGGILEIHATPPPGTVLKVTVPTQSS